MRLSCAYSCCLAHSLMIVFRTGIDSRGVTRDSTFLRKPRSQVNQLAPLAAERPEWRSLGPLDLPLARRAFDSSRAHRRRSTQLQQLKRNCTSPVAAVGRVASPFQL